MNKNAFLITATLAASFCWVGCNKSGKLSEPSAFKTPSGPVELKLKWLVGEQVRQSLGVKMNMEISGANLPNTINRDMTIGEDFGVNVLNATADGGHELEMEFLGIRMKMDQDGKSVIDYDSAKKSSIGSDNPALAGMDKMFQNIIGTKVRCFLNASNQVERIEGFDTLTNKLTVGRGDAANGMKSMFNEDSIKQMIEQDMPTKPVQPGDTWPEQTDIAMGDLGKVATDLTISFERWEMHGTRNCARLEFQGSMKGKSDSDSAPPGMTLSVDDGDTSGVAWFDPELGMVIESIMHNNLNVSITMPAYGRKNATQSMKMVMKQDITFKTESVK